MEQSTSLPYLPSVAYLTNLTNIPTATLENLKVNISRRLEVIIVANAELLAKAEMGCLMGLMYGQV